MSGYVPVLIALVFAMGLGIALWLLTTLFGPKNTAGGVDLFPRRNRSQSHTEPFECGNPGGEGFRQRFTVKFYAVALLFVLFDVEAVFLYPWATIFRQLGLFGFIEMSIFVGVLALGLVYVWRKGALEWT